MKLNNTTHKPTKYSLVIPGFVLLWVDGVEWKLQMYYPVNLADVKTRVA